MDPSPVPIATGENRFRVHEFGDLLYEFGADVITSSASSLALALGPPVVVR